MVLVTPLEEQHFFNYFEDTVNELSVLYNCFVFDKNELFTPPKTLTDDNTIKPLYHNSIVDNILFMATGQENYKNDFLRKSHLAFLKYWNENAKGKRMKRTRW